MITPNNEEKLNPMSTVSVALLPLPAQGHLNQLLHLAVHLASRSIPVHYIGSTVHNRQARDRSHFSTNSPLLHFHDFPLPTFPTPPPNPNSTTHFPTHLQPAFDAASLHLSLPLSSLFLSLSSTSRRVILIHDSTMGFATQLALPFKNVESYVFHSVSAFTNLFFLLQQVNPSAHSSSELTFQDCFSDEFLDFIRRQHGMTVKDHGRLLNTCRVIEGEFIDRLAQDPSWKDQKVFAIGPLNPIRVEKSTPSSSSSINAHECIEWLHKQPKNSVLYISFGTASAVPTDQMLELANGLKLSQQRFIWVLRDADRGDIYACKEKDRFEELINGPTTLGGAGDRGLVVRDWAPQLEILEHKATGGFLTHCGWNSCMESMSMGVPMLTWPMHSDQPRNSVLVTEVLKVGLVGRDWRKRREVLRAEAIRDSVVKLMAGEEGKKVRKKAEEVRVAIRHCGVSREELDSFVTYIRR